MGVAEVVHRLQPHLRVAKERALGERVVDHVELGPRGPAQRGACGLLRHGPAMVHPLSRHRGVPEVVAFCLDLDGKGRGMSTIACPEPAGGPWRPLVDPPGAIPSGGAEADAFATRRRLLHDRILGARARHVVVRPALRRGRPHLGGRGRDRNGRRRGAHRTGGRRPDHAEGLGGHLAHHRDDREVLRDRESAGDRTNGSTETTIRTVVRPGREASGSGAPLLVEARPARVFARGAPQALSPVRRARSVGDLVPMQAAVPGLRPALRAGGGRLSRRDGDQLRGRVRLLGRAMAIAMALTVPFIPVMPLIGASVVVLGGVPTVVLPAFEDAVGGGRVPDRAQRARLPHADGTRSPGRVAGVRRR